MGNCCGSCFGFSKKDRDSSEDLDGDSRVKEVGPTENYESEGCWSSCWRKFKIFFFKRSCPFVCHTEDMEIVSLEDNATNSAETTTKKEAASTSHDEIL
jgi:hypothetical protein